MTVRRIPPISEQVFLKGLFFYDQHTGVIRWAVPSGRWGRIPRGAVAGWASPLTKGGKKYRKISTNGKTYLAHHIAWVCWYGEWPTAGVDHINGDSTDNRISNLRLANQSQNCANSRISRNNKSGYKGVAWNKKRGKWVANICKNRKTINLGGYDTKEEAHAAYMNAAKELFGVFASSGA